VLLSPFQRKIYRKSIFSKFYLYIVSLIYENLYINKTLASLNKFYKEGKKAPENTRKGAGDPRSQLLYDFWPLQISLIWIHA
jgi:hypothetical protein